MRPVIPSTCVQIGTTVVVPVLTIVWTVVEDFCDIGLLSILCEPGEEETTHHHETKPKRERGEQNMNNNAPAVPNQPRLIFDNYISLSVWRKISGCFLILGGPPALFLFFEGITRDVSTSYGPTIPEIADNMAVLRGTIFGVVLFGLLCYSCCVVFTDRTCFTLTNKDLKEMLTVIAVPLILIVVSLGLWIGDDWTLIGGQVMPAAILPLILLCSMCCCVGSVTCLLALKDNDDRAIGCALTCGLFLLSIASTSFISLLGTRLGTYILAPDYNEYETMGQAQLVNDKSYSWISIFFPTIVAEIIIMPFYFGYGWKSWRKRNGVPGDTAQCTVFQIGSVMWLGWTVMRLILIVDDTYPETWTITNGGVSSRLVANANGTIDQLNDAMYSFDQMKQWQIKEEKMDAMYVSCVKYKYGNYYPGTSSSPGNYQNATKKQPTASIIGTRKLRIDDSPRISAVGICAANCKVNQMCWWIDRCVCNNDPDFCFSSLSLSFPLPPLSPLSFSLFFSPISRCYISILFIGSSCRTK